MKKILTCCVTALIVQSTFAGEERAEDSVVNGVRRGNSVVPIGATDQVHYILKAVPLSSNVSADHVGYGPFVNASEAAIKIHISGRQGNSWQQFGGWVDGIKIRDSSDAIEFEVPAGSKYYFAAKDTAYITVSTARVGLRERDIGLPLESDFKNPTGIPYACVILVYNEPPNAPPRYIYKVGDISDASVVLDQFNIYNPRFTYGPPSASAIPCEQVIHSNIFVDGVWNAQPERGAPDGG